jgi:hypothetical protein
MDSERTVAYSQATCRELPSVVPYLGLNEAACGGRRFAFDELAPTAW